jgi:hypothetical protein
LKIDEVRRQITALAADSPLAEWGRWILAEGATRSIGPAFTISPAEAGQLAAEMAARTSASATPFFRP